jgi:hypothetical protein
MTRADVRAGRWSLTGIAIHEIRFHKSPVYGHDFYPFEFPLPDVSEPAQTLSNTELAASARGAFSGWDLSFYIANVYDDNPHLELFPTGELVLEHSRLTMLGAAWALVAGDFVIKAEGAHFRGLQFFAAPEQTFSRSELLAGLEYFRLADTSITVEAVYRRLHGYFDDLGILPDQANESELDWVVRCTRFFLHQTLAVSLVAVTFGERAQDGAFQRLEARYDVTDRLEITGGVVLYQSGDRAGFTDVDDNDRLFLELVYRY